MAAPPARVTIRVVVQSSRRLLRDTLSACLAIRPDLTVVGKVAENQLLRAENIELQNRWREAEQKFAHINDDLDRVKRLNANLRHITQLNDPDRKLSIGSPDQQKGAGPEFGFG